LSLILVSVVVAASPRIIAMLSPGELSGPVRLGVLVLLGVGALCVFFPRIKTLSFLAIGGFAVLIAFSTRYDAQGALPLTQVAGTIVDSMGSSLGFIATIIGIGAIFGAILEHSGGTQSLANSLVRIFGKERAPWAMLLTGFIISIPVFLDVALVILAPLLFALARDTQKPLLVFGLPLVAGMAVTHAFVPPTPGPVAVAYILGVNLGWVILFGVIVGLPTAIICGPWLCGVFASRVDVPLPETEPSQVDDQSGLPSFGFILFLIALPIGLILANTIVEQIIAGQLPTEHVAGQTFSEGDLNADKIPIEAGDPLTNEERKPLLTKALANSSSLSQFITFLGHPVIALLLSTLIAIYFLGTQRGVDRETLLEISTKALGPAGIIILITGAGGVFKGVLKATGITVALTEVFQDTNISVLVLAWVFATLVRIAQGSATVAMLTAAGLMSGFVSELTQPELALVTIAIAAGATGFSHVNDSGFWMISRYFRMTEAQTLRTWSIISTIISLVGFGFTLLISRFL
ncbi:MAG: GntP family permease, partial [Pirellulales bacterium]|nr:GntP family permease [Pirellulales bacterium]